MARPKRPSFDEVYDVYGDNVYRLCARLAGSSADAEDLAQEVFLEVFEHWEQFEGRSLATTWLYRVALNRWRRMNSQREPETIPYDHEMVESSADYGSIPEQFQRMTLDDALASLSAPLREAFVLVKAQGLRYREAAQVLGVPMWQVQNRVRTASSQLRRALADDLG